MKNLSKFAIVVTSEVRNHLLPNQKVPNLPMLEDPDHAWSFLRSKYRLYW